MGIHNLKKKWCKEVEYCNEFGYPTFNLLCVLGATSGQGENIAYLKHMRKAGYFNDRISKKTFHYYLLFIEYIVISIESSKILKMLCNWCNYILEHNFPKKKNLPSTKNINKLISQDSRKCLDRGL